MALYYGLINGGKVVLWSQGLPTEKRPSLSLIHKFIIMAQQHLSVKVWDTYVTKTDGGIMHFDIIAPTTITDPEQVYGFGRAYLASKGQAGQALSTEQCRFCHIERLRPEWEASIREKGFFIIEMEGCD